MAEKKKVKNEKKPKTAKKASKATQKKQTSKKVSNTKKSVTAKKKNNTKKEGRNQKINRDVQEKQPKTEQLEEQTNEKPEDIKEGLREEVTKKVNESSSEGSDEYENFAIIDLKTIMIVIALLAVAIAYLVYIYFEEIDKSKNISAENSETLISSKEELNTRTNKLPIFNLENCVNLLRDYLNDRSIIYANPQLYVEGMGLTTGKEYASYEKTADESFVKTDILYDDVTKTFSGYVTQGFFMKEFKNIFKNSNGLTHVANIDNEKEMYTITKYEQIKGGGMPVIKVYYTTKTDKTPESEEKTMQVEFSPNKGKWLISNIK